VRCDVELRATAWTTKRRNVGIEIGPTSARLFLKHLERVMGEIADQMLDGTLCEGCGVYMGDECGHPRLCNACDEHKDEPAQNEVNRIVKKVACPTCQRMVKLAGLSAHIRDKHEKVVMYPEHLAKVERARIETIDAAIRICNANLSKTDARYVVEELMALKVKS
jgi:hypothetical protein